MQPSTKQTTNSIRVFRGKHRFLSNFWPCLIPFDGLVYPSVEHAYQAAKLDPALANLRENVRAASSPGQAKYLGRKYPLRNGWNLIRIDVMRKLLLQKFSIPSLQEKLLATGEADLVEGNWWKDLFWGVDAETGQGENHLGRLLMEVRSFYRDGC